MSTTNHAQRTTAAAARERLAGYRHRFDARFEAYFDSLAEHLDTPALSRFTPRCLDLLRDLSLRGGKRLRVALLYEAARLVSDEEPPGLEGAALSIELLQTHGLVHDDIIDDGPVRRGGPSTYYAYRHEFPGDPRTALGLAVLAGDLAAFLSMQVLLEADAPAAVKQAMLEVQLRAGAETVAGQITDLERDFEPLPSEDLLHTVCEYKSTRYSILAPLRLGLLAAGEHLAAHDERLRRYATLAGISGQMRDDYLDLFGDEHTTGKSPGSDIRSGRRSYAVRAVLAAATTAERALLESALGDPDCTAATIDRIRGIARDRGVDGELRSAVRRYAEDAAAEAATWRPHWRTEAVSFFEGLPLWNAQRTQ
ncbi:polyprenyl synthetase family protein [Streptomyces roseoverticillatus]|uniref:polyprenyl synthetase family protein n=1 Tax=Streptomyces roseoverticillatus TaxID=66429 RepID=UPI001F3FD528|nr:polyprenyl synthetase family protein [Streptomyces roseoverticillatus]MCF3101124.1 polyprenyl synthetase family protein [Streptomyces roseoverticillatus]